MSMRTFVFLCYLWTFSLVFSQGMKWEEALKQDPKNVISLDCSGQKWDSLPLEIFRFTNLKELNLSKNKLSQIPAHFNSFQAIEKLNLSRNKFEILAKFKGTNETQRAPIKLKVVCIIV